MADSGSMKVNRVVVVPLSGYINRLQAIASASIIADQCNTELAVCWADVNVTPAPVSEIFSTNFVERNVIDSSDFARLAGFQYNEVPAYLNVRASVVSIAGLDKGEQAFMPQLQSLIEQSQQPLTLVFSAGGNFSFSEPETAISQRGDWYRKFRFSAAIESRVNEFLTNRDPYVGLHLRYTDRSHQTPLERAIDQAISSQVELISTDSVFIASDTEKARDKWFRKLQRAGLKPWTAEVPLDSVLRTQAGVGAMVDWKILGHAQSSVYFAASSFGHEAAVMAGSLETSIALHGHAIQRVRSRSKELAGSLVNYPRNHWFR